MTNTPEILTKIIEHKKTELVERKLHMPLEKMQDMAKDAPSPRGFERALRGAQAAKRPGVIAEIKRASPSKGILRENFNPMEIAAGYQMNGASCVSVLTDTEFFKGSCAILELARKTCFLPMLRKDFIIDTYQVYETRAVDADCLLLIVAALEDEQMAELYALGRELRLDILVEVHNEEEMDRALKLEPTMIGINNRDLHTFDLSLDTTFKLLTKVPDHCHVVTESGIHTKSDVVLMMENGVNSFLVGEAFMVAENPGAKLKELFF
ncbi:MAG: indole-3-glycerol phosphate synthase TrpC [Gammaproteobacteria bacterium]|nr:indole-3-glycerol phosphate synthase TrpC [Gammaproteobacteria bacterium]